MAADEQKPEPLTIGDTTKKTINKTLVIGAALTATVILTPAAFAGEHHEPRRPSNGIQLAADIVNLVRAIVEPRPAPVIVTPPPEPVVTVPAVATPRTSTVIVTGAETATIPEYSYVLYENEYIPYYEGWLYLHDTWHWAGATPRPATPPRWKPNAHPRAPKHHGVIVLPDHRHAPAPVIRHEAPRREPVHTVVVRPDRKDAPRVEAPKTTRPDRKDAPRAGEAPKPDAPKKGR